MDAKKRILNASIKAFAASGKYGVRMETIASRARINRAMLYYYFHSRESLYREVLISILGTVIKGIFTGVGKIMKREKDPVKRLKGMLSAHFGSFSRDTDFSKILLEALSNHPEDLKFALASLKRDTSMDFSRTIEYLIKKDSSSGIFRNMDRKHFAISLMGMCLIHFMDTNLIQMILEMPKNTRGRFLRDRQKHIVDVLLHGILKHKR